MNRAARLNLLLSRAASSLTTCSSDIAQKAIKLILLKRHLISMPLQSNCISELLHAANRIHQLSQDELRHKLNVAVTLIGGALEKSEVRHLPRVIEAESYLRSVCASAQELHAEDAKAAFLHAVDIIHMLRKHASEEE